MAIFTLRFIKFASLDSSYSSLPFLPIPHFRSPHLTCTICFLDPFLILTIPTIPLSPYTLAFLTPQLVTHFTFSHRVGHSVIPTSTPTDETLSRTSNARFLPHVRTQPATSAPLPLQSSPIPPSNTSAPSNPFRAKSITSPEVMMKWPPVSDPWNPTIKTC